MRKLSAIVPASLKFCFKILTDETEFADTALNIRETPLSYQCRQCGANFEVDEITITCIECNAEGPLLIGGREMTIESIEAAD